MSRWITLHRMVHAVESLTLAMYDDEEYPTNQDEAEEMFQDHIDDDSGNIVIDDIVDSDLPHSYTTGKGEYVSIEKS
jgi:hypothetical protein